MTRVLETIVIGAGPYGLSATAHLRKAGVETRTFGSPMSFWRNHTPAGMRLRSPLGASDIASPDRGLTLATYLGDRGAIPDGPVSVSPCDYPISTADASRKFSPSKMDFVWSSKMARRFVRNE